jgi:hypothetical protein
MKSMSNPYGWSFAKKIGHYYAWSRVPKDKVELVWQLTATDVPPAVSEGYSSLEAIKELAGKLS